MHGNKSAHTLWALDAVTGERRAEAPTAPGPHELAVAPDRRLVVVSEYGERRDGATLAVFELPAFGLLRCRWASPCIPTGRRPSWP